MGARCIGAIYWLDVASTGADAVATCRTCEYWAVTLDLVLPDMSGTLEPIDIRTLPGVLAAQLANSAPEMP